MSTVNTMFTLKSIRFKPAKDEESPPTAEFVLSTEDLSAATTLAWSIGEDVKASVTAAQPPLGLSA